MYFRIQTVPKAVFALSALLVAASGCGEETRTRADASAIDAGALADGQVGCAGCTDDDGCCGTGCTAEVDNDCPADGVCGDGVLDPGETCDPPGSCPTTCDDGLGCTADITTGSAGTCDLACESTAIVECVSGDGCCAPGCDMAVDDDCLPFVLDPDYAAVYELRDLGSVPGVPPSYGGLVIDPATPDTLLIGGSANTASGALYAIGLTNS